MYSFDGEKRHCDKTDCVTSMDLTLSLFFFCTEKAIKSWCRILLTFCVRKLATLGGDGEILTALKPSLCGYISRWKQPRLPEQTQLCGSESVWNAAQILKVASGINRSRLPEWSHFLVVSMYHFFVCLHLCCDHEYEWWFLDKEIWDRFKMETPDQQRWTQHQRLFFICMRRKRQ